MKKFGSLQAIEKMTDPEAPWIVLLHGFGADATDLSSLSGVLQTPQKVNWLFPEGFLQVPIGAGFYGRAWWPINMEQLIESQQQGPQTDLRSVVPPGLKDARSRVQQALDRAGVDLSNTILGGFSQGAMLATDLYLHAPLRPRGLMIFSGTLIAEEVWKPLLAERKGAPFFQCHGQSDTVLGHNNAQRLETFLCQGGMKGRLVSFSGGHEIPPVAINKANEYLREVLR
jgi:phospholipase/carboxylesterase